MIPQMKPENGVNIPTSPVLLQDRRAVRSDAVTLAAQWPSRGRAYQAIE
jgi:hypothetical protein